MSNSLLRKKQLCEIQYGWSENNLTDKQEILDGNESEECDM
jgi:hypothetical protein